MEIIDILQAKDEIRELMADYWWYVETKQWDKLKSEVVCEDMEYIQYIAGYDTATNNRCHNADDWIAMIKSSFDNSFVCPVHQGHQSKIVITSETTAIGRFDLNDSIATKGTAVSQNFGYYVDDYIKVDGKWKIKTLRVCELFMMRSTIDGVHTTLALDNFVFKEGNI